MDEELNPTFSVAEKKAIVMGILPLFLRRELGNDRDFRNSIGINTEEQIAFDKEIAFPRFEFLERVREALAKKATEVEVKDRFNKSWVLSREQRNGERILLRVQGDASTYYVSEFFGFLVDRDERLREFSEVLKEHGFPPTEFAEWRKLLEERPLTADECEELLGRVACTPLSFSRALREKAEQSQVSEEDLVPSERAYFEFLAGVDKTESLQSFTEDILPDLIAGLLSWDETQGVRTALLLCSHSSVSAQIAESGLKKEKLLSLALWARDHGDLFAKVGAVEACLSISSESSELENALVEIVRQIIALDPTEKSSSLHLLAAMIVLVESEVCRNRTLQHLRPFQRRIATFAHASLLVREAADRVDVEEFCSWAMEKHTQSFFFQNLLDLRLEPRWLPEGADPTQLKQELLGRLLNVAEDNLDRIPEGPLREILSTRDPSSELNRTRTIRSFFPGPIEGADSSPRNNIPQEIEDALDHNLSLSKLTSDSVALLSYATGVFSVEADKANRAVEVIRESNFRFADQLDPSERIGLIRALAAAAGRLRNTPLAHSVRAVARAYREDSSSWYSEELIVAFISAGAFGSLETWMEFLGGWINELCLNVSKQDAFALEQPLNQICSIEPLLRRELGQGLAALKAIQ